MSSTTNKDTEWKEYEVHLDQGNDDEDEEEEYVNHFFEKDDDDDELLEFSFHTDHGDPIELGLRGHSEITNSTGLSVWLGAEVLCEFLLKNRALIQGKSVLELGSGLGLTGILVAEHLKASRTVLTDGDVGVLRTLRSNIESNTSASISCPQLIWGRNLEDFRERYGRFQVIVATDCVYMTTSLEPLWQTVHGLLEEEADAVVVYVNLCASQAPHEKVLEMADRFGFSWSAPSKDIYMFQRKTGAEK